MKYSVSRTSDPFWDNKSPCTNSFVNGEYSDWFWDDSKKERHTAIHSWYNIEIENLEEWLKTIPYPVRIEFTKSADWDIEILDMEEE